MAQNSYASLRGFSVALKVCSRLRGDIALSFLLLLPACASTPPSIRTAGCNETIDQTCYPVWFASNRKPLSDTDLDSGLGDATDESIHYGRRIVAVPNVPLNNSVKRAQPAILDDSPTIALDRDSDLSELVAWEGDMQSVLAALNPQDRDVVVYIHGFGTSFDQAVQQAATLGAALRVPGIMAMFSWPSQGKHSPLSYLADITSVENSEEELAGFLAHLGRLAGPGHVHVIAHSLGVYGFLRSMQSATARAQILEPQMHFGQIIFAAPDIDERLFRRLSAVVTPLSKRTTLYVADEDFAVKASELLHGDRRMGLLPIGSPIDAIDTIEVLGRPSKVEVGHSYFRDAPTVLRDIQTLLYFGESPEERHARNGFPVADDRQRMQAWIIHNQN